ncbi:MAG: ATP-binding protein [Candidatus Acidiferrum sp.]
MDKIFGLSSKMGAGKSTIARALSERFGIPRVSFGDYVREVARARHLQESRPALQELGESLVREDPDGFVRAVLSKVHFTSGAVIDGIRHIEILEAITKLVSPLGVVLVYVECDEQIRIRRLVERGMKVEEIGAADRHSTEMQIAGPLRARAVLEVRGDSDAAQAADKVSEWMTRSG